MIKRIELKNFMSHEHTVLEPAAGLTVLIGPNNVGKSAVIAALQILCSNDNSTYVTRHGAKECSVTIETDDGQTVTWKRKKSPSYLINDQNFDRLARNGVPDKLHDVLKMGRVEASNGDAFDIHFGAQKSPIFLLDQSGATAARFFASSSDAIKLVAMQQRHKEQVRDAKRERIQLDQQAAEINAELAALEPVIEIDERLEKLERDYDSLKSLESKISELTVDLAEITQQTTAVGGFRSESELLSELASPPEMSDTMGLQRLLFEWQQCLTFFTQINQQLQVLQSTSPPPEFNDTKHLQALIEELQQTLLTGESSTLQFQQLENLSPPPTQHSTQELAELVSRLSEATAEHRRCTEQVDSLSDLEELYYQDESGLAELVSELSRGLEQVQRQQQQITLLTDLPPISLPADTSDLELLLQELKIQSEEYQALQSSLKVVETELVEVAEEIRTAAQSENCPVCGGELNPERLMQQATGGRA